MLFLVAVMGLGAGLLSTVAGQGGGLVLIVAASALMGPHAALAVTTPAILAGNLHRYALYRRDVDMGIAVRLMLGAVPAAIVGGLLAGALPAGVLSATLVLITLLAVVKALGWLRFDVPRKALTPAGVVIGGLTGTSGGAGVLFAPVLFSLGLRGARYTGTISLIAVATHAGRVVAYGSSGIFTREHVVPTLVLAVMIFAGNALGGRVSRLLSVTATTRIELCALVLSVLLSVAGGR